MKSSIVHDNFSISFLSIFNAGKNGCDSNDDKNYRGSEWKK